MRQGFDISVNDYNRNLFASFKTVLEQKDGESTVHVLLKVLALILHYDPKIRVEPTEVDPQYSPDLLLSDLTGAPSLWIECGQVSTTKLDKLRSRYPDAAVVVVKRYPREAANLHERVEKEVRRPWGVTYVSFDPEFVDTASQLILGKNECTAIISDEEFQLILNERHLTTRIHRASHPPPGYSGKNYA